MTRLISSAKILMPGFVLTLLSAQSQNTSFADAKWRKEAILYQLYPRSFKDSNGNGMGIFRALSPNGITLAHWQILMHY
ncbi:MAG: hypothetical protein ABIQ88_00905 [Chitinophagaceae bacterium]